MAQYAVGKLVLGAIGLVATMACATSPAAAPARLVSASPEVVDRLMAMLKPIVGRQQIVLGPEILATTTTISVLPPPLGAMDMRSTVTPDIFDIEKRPTGCFLVRRATATAYPMTNIACVAVSTPQ